MALSKTMVEAEKESGYAMLTKHRLHHYHNHHDHDEEEEEEEEVTEGDEEDIEDNESDTTKISSSAEEPFGKILLPLRQTQRNGRGRRTGNRSDTFWTWIRWSTIVGLQSIIILLLSFHRKVSVDRTQMAQSVLEAGRTTKTTTRTTVETGGDINGLYRTSSHTYTYLKPDPDRFIPNMTSNDDRMEIRKNWDGLMPLGSGSVLIPNYKDHPLLGDPITDEEPVFETSWTHALRCLYYTIDNYHQLLVNGRRDTDTDNHNTHHATHCFEYLRNSILCNLDMTLEGSEGSSTSTPADKNKEEEGEGQPHVCRNRDEAITWMEARRRGDSQDIRLSVQSFL